MEYPVSDIDSISFSLSDERPYTPVVQHTNIESMYFDGFEYCPTSQRLFARGRGNGLYEYKNGQWEHLPNWFWYPSVGEYMGYIFVGTGDAIYRETPDKTDFYVAFNGYGDLAGSLGGNGKRFFAGCGACDPRGILGSGDNNDENGKSWFGVTAQQIGSFYSIAALGDDVFFGAGPMEINHPSVGVVRWDETLVNIVPTNITNGEFSVAAAQNRMFACGNGKVYIWDGTQFNEIATGGVIRSAGNNLYRFDSEGISRYDVASSSFVQFHSSEVNNYAEIEVFKGKLYAFNNLPGGVRIEVYDFKNQQWEESIQTDYPAVWTKHSLATEYGLFFTNPVSNTGIRVIVPTYN
jgi:hypothetical protein